MTQIFYLIGTSDVVQLPYEVKKHKIIDYAKFNIELATIDNTSRIKQYRRIQ